MKMGMMRTMLPWAVLAVLTVACGRRQRTVRMSLVNLGDNMEAGGDNSSARGTGNESPIAEPGGMDNGGMDNGGMDNGGMDNEAWTMAA